MESCPETTLSFATRIGDNEATQFSAVRLEVRVLVVLAVVRVCDAHLSGQLESRGHLEPSFAICPERVLG